MSFIEFAGWFSTITLVIGTIWKAKKNQRSTSAPLSTQMNEEDVDKVDGELGKIAR